MFRFRCEPQQHAPRSPASAFKLIEHGFYDPLEGTLGRHLDLQGYANTLAQCRAFDKEYLKRNEPRYVGSMPIMYVVDGVTAPTAQLFPVRRPPGNVLASAFVLTALEDFVRLCANSVNGHLPLRVSNPRLPFQPVPGRIVRSDGRWTWQPLFTSWKEYLDGRAGLEHGPLAMTEGLTSGLSPMALMNVFSRFWGIPGDYNGAGGA